MTNNITGYDLIGDIHGHATEMKQILQQMGYAPKDGVWQHAHRKVIFVGDYIDRGPEIREVLQIVKAMTDAGSAFAIMGNHEYNALAFNYHNSDGGYIRPHNTKNLQQHGATLKQFQSFATEWDEYLEWIANLPLFLERDGLRAVHACWDDTNIAALKKIRGPLTKEILLAAHDKSHSTHTVFEETLKGKELRLPDGHFFIDKDGHRRNQCRTKWWLQSKGLSFGDYLFYAPQTVSNLLVPDDYLLNGYDSNAVPVFFGHYWLDPSTHASWQSPNVCCLDYSVGKGGNLVAYRYYFDEALTDKNFVTVAAQS